MIPTFEKYCTTSSSMNSMNLLLGSLSSEPHHRHHPPYHPHFPSISRRRFVFVSFSSSSSSSLDPPSFLLVVSAPSGCFEKTAIFNWYWDPKLSLGPTGSSRRLYPSQSRNIPPRPILPLVYHNPLDGISAQCLYWRMMAMTLAVLRYRIRQPTDGSTIWKIAWHPIDWLELKYCYWNRGQCRKRPCR